MKKLFFIFAVHLFSSGAYAAQVDMIIGSEGAKASLTTNFSRIQNNFTELFGRTQTDNNFTTPLKNKLDALPEGTNILTRTNTDEYTPSLDYHPATKKYVDDAPFAPALGEDDNYVTDAEKTVIGNTSGANTGDQSAATVPVTDAGGYFTGTDVETIFQEMGPLTDAVELTAGPNITITDGVISSTGGGSFTFDTFPTYEDSPHTSGIARNATTGAMYSEIAGKWLTFALTDTLDPAPVSGISDDFSADSSADYTAITGGMSVAGGSAGGTAWAKSYLYHETSLATADQNVRADVAYNGTVDSGGIIFRADTGGTGYQALLANGRIILYSFTGTTLTFVAQSADNTRTSGTYNIRATISGTAINIYENGSGAAIISTTDATYSAGNYCGIAFRREGLNFDARVDNFTGNAL